MKLHVHLSTFYRYRELLSELVKRDIKVRYRRSILGMVWSVLNPLLSMLVMSFVFSNIFRNDLQNFPVYLLTGQLVFRGQNVAEETVEKGEEAAGNFGGGHPTESFVSDLPDHSTRLMLHFTDGATVFFNDQRKFGWMKVVPTLQIPEQDFIAKLGPEIADFSRPGYGGTAEAITDETFDEFIARARRHRRSPVKAVMTFAESFAQWSASARPSPEISMLGRKLDALLAAFGLELYGQPGDHFDPALHEACGTRHAADFAENALLEVLRPGFRSSGGVVLSYALVVVNRPEAEPEND